MAVGLYCTKVSTICIISSCYIYNIIKPRQLWKKKSGTITIREDSLKKKTVSVSGHIRYSYLIKIELFIPVRFSLFGGGGGGGAF